LPEPAKGVSGFLVMSDIRTNKASKWSYDNFFMKARTDVGLEPVRRLGPGAAF